MSTRNASSASQNNISEPSSTNTYTCAADIQATVDSMKAWLATGKTLPLHTRRNVLQSLKTYLKKHEDEALDALHQDLGKAHFEGFATELGIVYDELRICMNNIYAWAKPRRVSTSVVHFPSSSHVYPSPYGVVAVLSPWNYPLQLSLVPMIDALCAGNCVVLKPSRTSPATSAFLQNLCDEVFDTNLVCCLPTGQDVNEWLLDVHFDKIFFTGSPRVGKEIMRSAANTLTEVTLELGGKSPCIIANDASIKRAAQRIAWGKCINSGQTCVAPDYFLVHEDIVDRFIRELGIWLHKYYGENILESNDYPHMINEHHFDRVCKLIDNRNEDAQIAFGGARDKATLKIEPTVLTGVTLDDLVMQEEIFGPVLPIITWKTWKEAHAIISSFPSPLACYIFSKSKVFQEQVISSIPFGGATINDVVIHLANNRMGFGGFGESGIGAYHGKAGFDCFTHYKSTLKKSTLIEMPVRNPPFNKLKMRIVKMLMR